MNYLDTLYRAFLEYRKQTKNDEICKRQRNAVRISDVTADKIEITETKCTIESDWIDAIEAGLVYVEKAIREERQFIRSNGEVVPIEKAKNIGKESVEHLARHSQFLTKEPEEGGDIIPDQIYTVERLTDYAVYENRFLYMLLCYLRDFIALRYNKILDLTNTYSGNMTMNKNILADKVKMTYSVTLTEERKDDEYLKTHNECKDIISRIDLIYKIVMRFLSTPLMDEVSKAPMLKPPITKTNVLKMNHNFKNAVALYEFVTSYNKDGFSVEKSVKTIHPFGEELADEISESVIMSSFLTYYHGLGIKDYLKERYDEENARIAQLKQVEKDELIKRLQRDVRENGGDVYEYMLLLEDRMRALRQDCADFAKLKEDFEKLTAERDELENRVLLNTEYIENLITTHKQEIEEIQEKNDLYVNELTADFNRQITEIQNELAKTKQTAAEVECALRQEIQQTIAEAESKIAQAVSEANERISQVTRESSEKINAITRELNEKVSLANKDRDEKIKAYNELNDRYAFMMGRFNAMRREAGLVGNPEQYTTKEAFLEIEHQYAMFKRFFKEEWQHAKKRIRTDVFTNFKQETIQDKKERQEKAVKKQQEKLDALMAEKKKTEIKNDGSTALSNSIEKEQVAATQYVAEQAQSPVQPEIKPKNTVESEQLAPAIEQAPNLLQAPQTANESQDLAQNLSEDSVTTAQSESDTAKKIEDNDYEE